MGKVAELKRLTESSKQKLIASMLGNLEKLNISEEPDKDIVTKFNKIKNSDDPQDNWDMAVANIFMYSHTQMEFHLKRVEKEYQAFRSEEEGELDNPHFWIESSPALSMLNYLRELNKSLGRLSNSRYKEVPKKLKDVASDLSTFLGHLNAKTKSWYQTDKDFEVAIANLKFLLTNYYEKQK